MFDLDPRDRDDERRDLEVQWVELGRGPSSGRGDDDPSEGEPDTRDRDREARERETDPRDAFSADLDLPRGHERELVLVGRDEYTLNRDDARTLSTVGAFRIVSERDLPDVRDDSVPHLREQDLVRYVSIDARDRVVTLTDRGQRLLEHYRRDHDDGRSQEFYAGVRNPRELSHDAKVYAAYQREAQRLSDQGAHIHRVVLDDELKREYQQWLHEHNCGRSDSDGRPDRDAGEIAEWAREHELPYFDESVHFPDVRIEYELDHREEHLDVEVVTPNYRGAHGASRARSGFTCVGGGSRGGGHPFDPDHAGEYV
jgi:hypothetical protein